MKKYIVLLALALFLTFTLIGDSWVAGYDQRIKLTIDSTKIDADLSDFPVTVFFTSTQGEEIFVEFDADGDFDRGQFALTNDTLLYAEKELFNDSAQLAIYHVKVTSIASSADTDVYFYYDNDAGNNTTYIGAINTVAGAAVWDSNFQAVYHMVDDNGNVDDSTSNNNDGTKASANNPLEIAGKIGQGQDFSSDYIDISDSNSLNVDIENAGQITIEVVIKHDIDPTAYEMWVDKSDSGYALRVYVNTKKTLMRLNIDSSSKNMVGTNLISGGNWYYMAGTWQSGTGILYANGTVDTITLGTLGTDTGTMTIDTTILRLGDLPAGGYPLAGILDEIRISKAVRSAAWIKGTYNSLWDTLFTYGSEETEVVVEVNALFWANF